MKESRPVVKVFVRSGCAGLVGGHAGLFLGMLATRSFFSELSGYFHVAMVVPVSSILVAALVSGILFTTTHLVTRCTDATRSLLIIAPTMAGAAALALHAWIWLELVRTGQQ